MIKTEIDAKNFSEHNAFCSLPMTKLIINSDGFVSMCCYQLDQLGNILEQELLDIWNSPKAKEVREATIKGELHSMCKSWNVCPFIVQEKVPINFLAYKRLTFPTWVEINLPDSHCNIGGEVPNDKNPACIMCIRNHRKPTQKDLTDLMCDKLTPLMPYLKHLCILGIAEPFWKNKAFDILEKLKFEKYRNQIRFETNTNGILMTPKIVEKFLSIVSWSDISFSIDAATPATFQKIRRVDAFNQICDNIQNYIQVLKSRELMEYQHVVKIWNNINLLNVHEMVQMVELADKLEVDRLIMLPTHDQNGLVHLGELLLNNKNVQIFSENAEKAMARANELGVDLIYAKPFDLVPPPIYENLVQLF